MVDAGEDAALDPRVTTPWGEVVCGDCGVRYICTPTNDHYLRADDPEGSPKVCFACLCKGMA